MNILKIKRNSISEKILAFLIAIALFATSNLLFSMFRNSWSADAATNFFTADYSNKAEVLNAAHELNKDMVEEGIVLLKNENNVLPIASGSRISVFGKNSVNVARGGSGSSSGYDSTAIEFIDALKTEGVTVNPTLEAFYKDNNASGSTRPGGSIGTVYWGYRTAETPQSSYTTAVKNSYAQYNDYAMIVYSRTGGEGFDLPTTMRSGAAESSSKTEGARDKSDHYLQLDQNELDLLIAVCENAAFSKVIIVINAGNAMELGFLDNPKDYFATRGYTSCPISDSNLTKIQGAISIGMYGTKGATSAAQLITGKANPSGKLADTFSRNFKNDPVWQNFSTNLVSGGNANGTPYVHYDEDIYMGYRYFETRYVTESSATRDAWYSANVVYPFGYGLSYTTFSMELLSCESSSGTNLEKFGTITTRVKVTNTGSVAGKEVVQLYYSSPYTAGGIEKAHVVLGDFAKTSLLAPGASEELVITTNVSDMYSYDWSDANGNDFKGYELEAGEYKIIAAKNAHDAAQLPANRTKTFTITEGFKYDKDTTTGADVGNLFDDVSGTGKVNSAPFLGVRQYFSRENFAGTFPTSGASKNSFGRQTVVNIDTSPAGDAVAPYFTDVDPIQANTSNPNNPIKLWHLTGRDYDDPLWDLLLNQLTRNELNTLPGDGAFHSLALASIDKPRALDLDGPLGLVGYKGDGTRNTNTCGYASSTIVAQTYNKELAYAYGVMLGNEALLLGNYQGVARASGIYAPGINTHRSPFGGRNFEYFSEDGLLAGKLAAQVVKGSLTKGLYSYMKHYFLNDQETQRGSTNTWVSEQAMREIYAKPFELCVKEGGANALMCGMNRIGNIKAENNYAALTGLLRNEWGFRGVVISDWNTEVKNPDHLVRTGCDLLLQGDPNPAKPPSNTTATNTPTHNTAVRTAVKNILYTVANSNAMNGTTVGNSLTASYSNQYVTILRTKDVNATIDNAFGYQGISGQFNYSVKSGTLPAGLTLNSNGTITGSTSVAEGDYSFTVEATDASGAFVPYAPVSATVNIKVLAANYSGFVYDFNNYSLGSIPVGFPATISLPQANYYDNGTHDNEGLTYALKSGSTLPDGLTLENGVITGTPTAAASKNFTVVVSKGANSVEASFSLTTIKHTIAYTGKALTAATVGLSYSASVTSATVSPSTTQGIQYGLKQGSSLPDGLSMTGGVISGFPARAYDDAVEFTIVAYIPNIADEVSADFSIQVNGIVFDNTKYTVQVGEKFSQYLDAHLNVNATVDAEFIYTITTAGDALPEGVSFFEDGEFNGTFDTLGTHTFVITVQRTGFNKVTSTIQFEVVEELENGGGDNNKKGCFGTTSDTNPFTDLMLPLGVLAAGVWISFNLLSKKKELN